MSENEPTNEGKFWYIVYTLPRAEKKLAQHLRKYKVDSYLPLITERKKWSDRFRMIDTPCFKSYLFVHIDFWKERMKVLQLPGSHHFVFDKGVPATVTIEEIEELRNILKIRTESIEVRENEALQKGKFVKVISGPLAGKILEIEKRKNKVAVFLRFSAMNQVVITEMKIEDIEWEELKL